MKQIILELENLDCEGCANSIRRAILRQPGILSVHIEVKAGRVDLTCEDDIDRTHVIGILDGLGYAQLGRNSMISMARAKLSCELGKIRHRNYFNPSMG
jgi:copper chaperone CopZ